MYGRLTPITRAAASNCSSGAIRELPVCVVPCCSLVSSRDPFHLHPWPGFSGVPPRQCHTVCPHFQTRGTWLSNSRHTTHAGRRLNWDQMSSSGLGADSRGNPWVLGILSGVTVPHPFFPSSLPALLSPVLLSYSFQFSLETQVLPDARDGGRKAYHTGGNCECVRAALPVDICPIWPSDHYGHQSRRGTSRNEVPGKKRLGAGFTCCRASRAKEDPLASQAGTA
ncbi:hypothetical protein VTI74DRAFT_2986 [Chaetomium olivicolor]